MSRSRVRVLAGFVGALVAAGVSLVPVAADAATVPGVPKATALVSVKAHRLANVVVAAHGVSAVRVLGTAGVPATGVAAVVIKLTASKPGATGALVAYPTGAKRPAQLSVSFTTGHDATSVVVVVPGSKGRISTANLSAKGVRVIPTVVGYYRKATATSAALTYFKAVAAHQAVSVRVAAGGSVAVTLAGSHGVPATGTSGVVVELSALSPAKGGTLTVSPSAGTRSKVTALSFVAGRNATNAVTADAGSKGRVIIANHSKGAVRVQVGLVGYLVALSPIGGSPAGVTVAPHAGGARVTWLAAKTDPGSPVLRYGVVVSQTLPKPVTQLIYTTGPVLTLDVTGLVAGVDYTFQVFAVTVEGHSAPSPATAPVNLSVPAAPTAVTAVSSAAGSVTVTWAKPVDLGPAITGYTITGAHAGPVSVAGTATSYTFTGLTVGQTLVAAVIADNAIGTSAPSAPSAAVIVSGAPGTNVTSAVSVASDGTFHGPVLSAAPAASSTDGRYVAFSASSALVGNDSNGANDVFLRDRVAGTTIRLSSNYLTGDAGNGVSTDVTITPDGHYVAFDSTASDLVPGDMNGKEDVFVYDTTAPAATALTRVSLSDTGTEGDKDSLKPAISADGQTVAFLSYSTNLVGAETATGHNVYVRTLGASPTTTRVSVAVGGGFPAETIQSSTGPSISADGRFVGYVSDAANVVADDSNLLPDAFVYDRTAGTTTRVSVGQGGVQANGASGVPVFSSDAHLVAFQSDASNLVAGDTNAKTDIFVRDLVGGTTTRVSVTDSGAQANDASTSPYLSADGTRVLFTSAATNLVVGDTNGVSDAFVRRLATGETIRVSVGAGGQLATGGAARGMSGNGLVALFSSPDATIGGAADTNGTDDLFARTLG